MLIAFTTRTNAFWEISKLAGARKDKLFNWSHILTPGEEQTRSKNNFYCTVNMARHTIKVYFFGVRFSRLCSDGNCFRKIGVGAWEITHTQEPLRAYCAYERYIIFNDASSEVVSRTNALDVLLSSNTSKRTLNPRGAMCVLSPSKERYRSHTFCLRAVQVCEHFKSVLLLTIQKLYHSSWKPP